MGFLQVWMNTVIRVNLVFYCFHCQLWYFNRYFCSSYLINILIIHSSFHFGLVMACYTTLILHCYFLQFCQIYYHLRLFNDEIKYCHFRYRHAYFLLQLDYFLLKFAAFLKYFEFDFHLLFDYQRYPKSMKWDSSNYFVLSLTYSIFDD